MSNSDPKPWDEVKNPHIRALCEAMQHLPNWLAAKDRKAAEDEEFRRRVWEQACLDASLIKRPAANCIKRDF